MSNQIQNPNIKNLLDKYGIKPNKRMGQNFLVDESVLEKIIAAAEISQNDTILEIGPGLGTLTMELAKKAKKVIAVEKDRAMIRILNNELRIKNIENVEVIHDDILKMPNAKIQIIPKQTQSSNYKLIANLPYYITSPVIRLFLETDNKPELMVLMVQKEVGLRICACPQRQQAGLLGGRAKPGQMSILAVAVQLYARPEIISEVPKTSFYPQPKVDSAIIRITPRINTNPITNNHKFNTEQFFKLVRAGFSSKRKFLISNLSRELKIENCKLKIVFDQIQFDQKLRAENLSIENWLKIYENLEKNIQ